MAGMRSPIDFLAEGQCQRPGRGGNRSFPRLPYETRAFRDCEKSLPDFKLKVRTPEMKAEKGLLRRYFA